jgi:hypothetical protein
VGNKVNYIISYYESYYIYWEISLFMHENASEKHMSQSICNKTCV